MKYCINGLVIHSDRAALPSVRKSKRFLAFIGKIGKQVSGVDYGCGKLRHLHEMLDVFDFLTVVDSDAQLTKVQQVHGIKTTVEKYCSRYRGRVKVLRICEALAFKDTHDWVFLNNVLSALPESHARIEALANARTLLRPGGRILIVTQYKNSRFHRFRQGHPHLDGHIYRSRRGLHFFGRISSRTLRRYMRKTRFKSVVIQSIKGYYFTTAVK